MTPIAVAAKHLINAGVTGDALVAAIAEIEESISVRSIEKSKASERQRRYREKRNALRTGDNKVSFPAPLSSNPPISKEKTPKGVKKKSSAPCAELLEIWKVYPKRRAGSKEAAEKALLEAKCRGGTFSQILDAAKAYATSEEATKDNGKFAKGLAAWLNADRWLDEYSAPKPEPPDPNKPITAEQYDFAKRIGVNTLNSKHYHELIQRYEKQQGANHGN